MLDIIDIIKYSVSTPLRVGKSYFGIIVFGILLYALMFSINVLPYYLLDHETLTDFSQGLSAEIAYTFSTVIFGLYSKLLIALVLFVTFRVKELRYVLPSDIIAGFRIHIKTILLLALSFTILIEVIGFVITFSIELFTDPFKIRWVYEIVRYILWPIIFTLYSLCLLDLFLNNKGFNESFVGALKILEKSKLCVILIVVILYSASNYIPYELVNSLTTEHLNEYINSSGRGFDFIARALIEINSRLNGVISVILLTMFCGGVIRLSKVE